MEGINATKKPSTEGDSETEMQPQKAVFLKGSRKRKRYHNLCAAASMTTDLKAGTTIRKSKVSMALLLLVAIGIANIPGLTVT